MWKVSEEDGKSSKIFRKNSAIKSKGSRRQCRVRAYYARSLRSSITGSPQNVPLLYTYTMKKAWNNSSLENAKKKRKKCIPIWDPRICVVVKKNWHSCLSIFLLLLTNKRRGEKLIIKKGMIWSYKVNDLMYVRGKIVNTYEWVCAKYFFPSPHQPHVLHSTHKKCIKKKH